MRTSNRLKVRKLLDKLLDQLNESGYGLSPKLKVFLQRLEVATVPR